MSIYKNEAARQTMDAWYQRFVDDLRDPPHFVSVDTEFGPTNVLCTGPADAPPLMCFHGVMGSAPSALSLIEPLVPHFRIVFPDTVGQPGRSAPTYLPLRGDSYGRWALNVLDALELPTTRMLGVSMGGYIALKVAALAPERIDALSLWVPGGLANGRVLDGLRLGWASLWAYLRPSDARVRRLFDALFTDYDARWFAFYSDSIKSLKMDRRMPQLASDDDFAALTAPVQLFANKHDVLFPAPELLRRARRVFPNLVQAETLEGFRHVPPFADGAVAPTLTRIRDFLLAPERQPTTG